MTAVRDNLGVRRTKISRKRVTHACQTCRSRKIKCDLGRPSCEQCLKTAHRCVYVATERDPHVPVRSHSIEDSDSNASETVFSHLGVIVPVGTRERYIDRSTWLPDALTTADASPDDQPGHDAVGSSRLRDTPETLMTPTWLPLVSRVEVERLFRWFLDYCHFFIPAATPADLDRLLEAYTFNGQTLSEDDSLLLASVCHVSSSAVEAQSPQTSLAVSSGQWKELADTALERSRCPLNLTQIKASILLSMLSMSEAAGSPSIGPTALLIRNAQLAGLHREPSLLKIEPAAAEERRRIFWIIHDLDTCFSIIHGLPALLDAHQYDVRELADEDTPSTKFLFYKSKASIIYSKMIRDVYGTTPLTMATFNALAAEAAALEEKIERLVLPQGAVWQFVQCSVRLIAQRLVVTLHQPYLRQTKWPSISRERALNSATKFIETFITCAADFTFGPLHWILHLFNAFQPCAVILQDLITCPKSAECEDLREVLESCFDQLGNDKHHHHHHHHWTIMRQLRDKAWAANGWTESETTDVSSVDTTDWEVLLATFTADYPMFGNSQEMMLS